MSVTITAQIPEEHAEYLRLRAVEQRQGVDEAITAILEESRRSREFPGITFADRPNGQRKAVVGGGMDVWEYIFILRGVDWDLATATKLMGLPERPFSLALSYYRAHPEEIDQYLAALDALPDDLP